MTAYAVARPREVGVRVIGTALAARLGVPFLDLDREFGARSGDISQFLSRSYGGANATDQNLNDGVDWAHRVDLRRREISVDREAAI